MVLPDAEDQFEVLQDDGDGKRPPILHVSDVADPVGWARERRGELKALVALHGALVVRGLRLREASTAGAVLRELSDDLMVEREAFAPRWVYEPGVYSSSKWPPNQPMCMHHELSYALEVPSMMMFACLSAPTAGGATAVADAARMLRALPAGLVDRFERVGWQLVRSYNEEIGVSWQEAFGTADRSEVEAYARANGISAEFRPDGTLRTVQRRRAVVDDPGSGERVWFNQIAFLNEWTMAPDIREYLVDMYGRDGLPFTTRFGDGEEITQDVVDLINATYDSLTLQEPWAVGDLMLVDNVRMSHSRPPYEGPREVLVAMADPVRLDHGMPDSASDGASDGAADGTATGRR